MSEHLKSILNLLTCPDDGQSLGLASTQLSCIGCGRTFPVHDGDVVELLPSNPVSLPATINAEYRNTYLKLFEQPFQRDDDCLAWGAKEASTESWVRKRERQVVALQPLVTDGIDAADVLCDIAAGAGYYTFAYRQHFRLVLHCDLSVANLSYASRRAREQEVDNILLLRIDYFQPPFRHSLNRLLCLDTLIRGEEHDSMLLRSIARCLRPTGRAVVDFHNWWHNPLRRLGILPDNFHHNRSYWRFETHNLLRKAKIQEANRFRFVQEFKVGTQLERVCSRAVPATRFVYSIRVGPDPLQTTSLAGAHKR